MPSAQTGYSRFEPLGRGSAPIRGGRERGRSLPLALTFLIALSASGCSEASGPAATPGEPVALVVAEGDGVEAPGGTVVPQGPTVRLLDSAGEPVVGATIRFQVLAGGGKLVGEDVQTDPEGRASAVWILGRGRGEDQRVRASFGDLSAEIAARSVYPSVDHIYQGRNGYVEYLPGNVPLVLTAPHGGDLEPNEIPNRGFGTTARDRNTRELALAIREAVFIETGGYPHVVLSNLHRIKLDPNREIAEAAQGNPEAERAWWEFQIFADEAGELVTEGFGEGLHLDIHGHAHEIPRVEIGYLLSRTDLALEDQALSGPSFLNKSSIRALASKPGETLATLVRGPLSLGALLEASVAPAVPSLNQPNPGQDEYFTGGYNTVRHGSRDGGTIDAIQLEHHFPGLRDEPENRIRYAEGLARVLVEYFQAHYGVRLEPGGES